jgi:WD40 repeat protein
LRINCGGPIGVVHALAFTSDSSRLCSAGTDKTVDVWNLSVFTRDLQAVFLHERTIRWQVARGTRGHIYALAVDPKEGVLALGGYGAMTSLGEILVVDPKSGRLVRVLEGHRQTVCSLGFSPDGQWLVSCDLWGQTILWKRGQWKPDVLRQPDEQTYGIDTAKLIERRGVEKRLAVFSGAGRVVVPVYVGQADDGTLRWQLREVSLADRNDVRNLEPFHRGAVTALAATPDGTRLASADWAGDFRTGKGTLYLWDLRGGKVRVQRRDPGAKVLCLAFSPDGRTLVAGTTPLKAGREPAQLQVWDTGTFQPTRRRTCPDNVQACAVSPDGKQLAYSGGRAGQVFCEPLDGSREPRVLHGRGRRVHKVAFAAKEPLGRVAFGTEFRYRAFNDYGDLEETFDPERLAASRGPLGPGEWLSPDWGAGGWTASRTPQGALQLYLNHQPKGLVAPRTVLDEGAIRCYCWVPDKEGKPFAIAVGTELQNSIYVCGLAEKGTCPILRHFRGHEDYVTSVGVSADRKYLVSGAADGTIAFWSLADLEQGATLYGRWGAELTIAGEEAAGAKGQLVVERIHPAGPLFHKGMRQGDVLSEIRWFEQRGVGGAAGSIQGGVLRTEKQPAAMLEALRKLPWGTEVIFGYRRGGAARPPFVLRPAWQPLVSLLVAGDGQWAFWTPEGYYDASENGYTLFGWQVNHVSLEIMPDFYRADQFHKTLERPEVMRRLLQDGSLDEALRRAKVVPKVELQNMVPDRIAQTPKVEIVSPDTDAAIPGNVAKVVARIQVPAAIQKPEEVRVYAYASGVIAARPPKRIPGPATKEGRQETYEFEVPLPTEARTLIEVVAGTPEITAPRDVVVIRPGVAPPKTPRKLTILAVGINKYKDPKIGNLEGPVFDAQAVLDQLRKQSKGLYVVETADLLTNENVTPAKWHQALGQIKDRLLQTAQPDDLVVLFLAGHGVRDPKSGKYYYLGYEFPLADYRSGVFKDCISWDDFRVLADIPCRKVALLDTCHSGAIQPTSTDAKTAVRGLQDAVIFTVTAATGDQLSIEPVGAKHGIFTTAILEGLSGRANAARQGGAPDRVVTLGELVQYVQRAVPQTAQKILAGIPDVQRRGQNTQQPTAAPQELIPYANEIPLTQPGTTKDQG